MEERGFGFSFELVFALGDLAVFVVDLVALLGDLFGEVVAAFGLLVAGVEFDLLGEGVALLAGVAEEVVGLGFLRWRVFLAPRSLRRRKPSGPPMTRPTRMKHHGLAGGGGEEGGGVGAWSNPWGKWRTPRERRRHGSGV